MDTIKKDNRIKYEQPSAKVFSYKVKTVILDGSNLENPKKGDDWGWDD